MNVSVVVKALQHGKEVVRKLDISFSLLKFGPESSNQIKLRKLIDLLGEYLARDNFFGYCHESISVKCSYGLAEAAISFKDWADGIRIAETEMSVLLLKEPQALAEADDPRLKIPKKNLNFDAAHAIHDPDAKGYCKHCFRKINKHNMNAFCEQRRKDMLADAMPAEKKKRIEQEAEQYALSGFRR